MTKQLFSFYRPHKRVVFKSNKPSRTKQEFRDECNINSIMAKYQKGEMVTHVNRFGGNYGDFTSVQDYQSSLNQVMQAQDMFLTLPAKVRSEFHNDPGRFLAFVQDPKNADELVKMGLATARLPEASGEASPSSATPPPDKGPEPSGGQN